MPLLRTGTANGFSNLLGFTADNTDSLMLGTVWGAGPLGLYNRAYQLFMTSVMSFFSPLTSVIVPTANRAIAEGRQGQDILARAQTVLCGAAIWLLLVTSAVADYLIPLLLGSQWHQTIPLLQILAIGGAFKALSQTNYWAYLIEQQSRQLLFSNMVTKPLQIIFVVVAAFHSIEAVAWGFTLGRAVSWPINLVWLRKTANQDPWRFGLNGLRLLIAAGIAFAATITLYNLVNFSSSMLAILVGGVSTAVYLFAAIAMPGGRREASDTISLIRVIFERSGK